MVKKLNEINMQKILLQERFAQKKLQRKSKLCELIVIFSLCLIILCLHKYAPKINLPQKVSSVIHGVDGFDGVSVKNSYLTLSSFSHLPQEVKHV
tara:strand:+ start:846 stop:1130 length:285 start_codon:yes stop_codon:yes gene_type:complete